MLIFNLRACPIVEHTRAGWSGLLGWPSSIYGRIIPGTSLQLQWACPVPVRLHGFELFLPTGAYITSVRCGGGELLPCPEEVEPGLSSVLTIAGQPVVAAGAYISIAAHLPPESPCNNG